MKPITKCISTEMEGKKDTNRCKEKILTIM
jgi:hypothetical protein